MQRERFTHIKANDFVPWVKHKSALDIMDLNAGMQRRNERTNSSLSTAQRLAWINGAEILNVEIVTHAIHKMMYLQE